MGNIEEKIKMQDSIVALSQVHKNLLLDAATGVGKSFAAIRIIEKDDSLYYLLCKETTHIENWVEEFKKHSKEHLLSRVYIFCYDSLHKYENTTANLILDEAHALTPKRLEHLKTINFERVVALSATMYYEEKELLRELCGKYHTVTITLQNAIDKGLVPAPKIIVKELYLDNTEVKYSYVRKKGHSKENESIKLRTFEEVYAKRFSVLKGLRNVPKYTFTIKCTAKEWYSLISEDIDYWMDRNKNIAFQKSLKRKEFLSTLKTKEVRKLLLNLDSRYIMYSYNIKLCKQMAVSDNFVNSKNTKAFNNELIAKFNNEEIDNLNLVGMLTEAANLVKLATVIISQLDSKARKFIQRVGRSLRSENPLVYAFYIKGTKDEDYLKEALENINENYIYYE